MTSRWGHRTASRGSDAGPSDRTQRAAARISRARMLVVAGGLATFGLGATVAMANRTKHKTAATAFVGCIQISPGELGNRTLKLRTTGCRSNEQQITWPPAGSTGPTGPAGPTGPKGPTGPRGPQGPKGISNSQNAPSAIANNTGDQYSSGDEAISACPPGTALLGGGAVASPNSAIEASQPTGNNGWEAEAIKVTPGTGSFGLIVTAVCTN